MIIVSCVNVLRMKTKLFKYSITILICVFVAAVNTFCFTKIGSVDHLGEFGEDVAVEIITFFQRHCKI